MSSNASTSNTGGIRRSRQIRSNGQRGRRRVRGGTRGPTSWVDRPFTARDAYNTGRSAYAMAKQALALSNAEKKHIDFSGSLTPGSTPALVCINAMATGDTDITRDGLSVRMKKLQLQLIMYLNATQPAYEVVRFVLIRHYMPAGVDLTNALVFATTAINSFTNWHSRTLFEILYDHSFDLSPSTPSVTVSAEFKLDDVVKWNGNTSASTDINQNSYWLMVWGVENTNKTAIGYQTRMQFYDN